MLYDTTLDDRPSRCLVHVSPNSPSFTPANLIDQYLALPTLMIILFSILSLTTWYVFFWPSTCLICCLILLLARSGLMIGMWVVLRIPVLRPFDCAVIVRMSEGSIGFFILSSSTLDLRTKMAAIQTYSSTGALHLDDDRVREIPLFSTRCPIAQLPVAPLGTSARPRHDCSFTQRLLPAEPLAGS